MQWLNIAKKNLSTIHQAELSCRKLCNIKVSGIWIHTIEIEIFVGVNWEFEVVNDEWLKLCWKLWWELGVSTRFQPLWKTFQSKHFFKLSRFATSKSQLTFLRKIQFRWYGFKHQILQYCIGFLTWQFSHQGISLQCLIWV